MKKLHSKYKSGDSIIRVVNNDGDGFYLYNKSWQFLYKAENTADALDWIGANYEPTEGYIHKHQD